MFEDSLFATNQHRSPQRGLAAVLSFCVQAVVLGLLVLIPLFYTDAVPLTALKAYVEIPVPPGPPAQPPPQQQIRRTSHPQESNFENAVLIQPRTIPDRIAHPIDDPNDVPSPPGPYIQGSTGVAGPAGSQVFRDLIASNMHPAPPVASITTHPKAVRLSSGVVEGLLVRKITPIYPKLAIIAHQQGTVVLQAQIGRDGSIENLHAVSGPPMLIQAAIDAVRQWRYRPYLLNNEPVEVDTQISVIFTLGG